MEKQTSFSQRSQTDIRSVASSKDGIGVNRTFLHSKVNDIREKLRELESGSFLEQISRIERTAEHFAEQSETLSLRALLLGFEVERLGSCLHGSELRAQSIEAEIIQQQAEAQSAIEEAQERYAEKERQLARAQGEADEAKALRRERTELISRLGEKDAITRELETRATALLGEAKTLRTALARAEEETAAQKRRQSDTECATLERLAALQRTHEEQLRELEEGQRLQIEARVAEALKIRRREEDLERQRQADIFRVQLSNKDAELSTKAREIGDLEAKLNDVGEEVVRLNTALSATQAALEERESELEARELQLSARLTEREEAALQEKHALQQRLQSNHKSAIEAIHAQHENELKALRKKLIDAENNALYITKEKAFLETTLNEARTENERLRNESLQLREDFEEEYESLTQQMELHRANSLDAKELEARFGAERCSYDAQIAQVNNKIAELNTQIGNLTDDNRRLNLQTIERLHEIERFRNSRVPDIETEETTVLKKRLTETREENDALQERALRLSSEKNQLSARLKGLETELELLRSEHNDIKRILETKKADLRESEDNIAKSKRECIELANEKTRMAGDILILQEKNQAFMTNYEILIKERDHYKRSYETADLEHSVTNKNLIEKIREVDEIRQRYEEALGNVEQRVPWAISKKPTLAGRQASLHKDDFSHMS